MWSLLLLLLSTFTNATIKISDTEIYELTPFGYWLSDCIHHVPSSSNIINHDNHFTINGIKQSRCHTPHNSTYIQQQISSHSQSTTTNTNLTALPGNGWQAYVKQRMGDAVTGFEGNWIVPSLPVKPSTNEVLYTFPALQNTDWVPPENKPTGDFDIIQPVLQYGYKSGKGGKTQKIYIQFSTIFYFVHILLDVYIFINVCIFCMFFKGGLFWSISSWYVTLSNDVIQSPLVRVNPGDLVYGSMKKIGNDTWYINSRDETSKMNTSFSVSRTILSAQPWVYVALEVYNIDDCNQFPSKGTTIPFSNLELDTTQGKTPIEWAEGNNGQTPPVCDVKVSTYSSNAVTIAF